MRLFDKRRPWQTTIHPTSRMVPSLGWMALMASSATSNSALEIPEQWSESEMASIPGAFSETKECLPTLHPEDPFLHLIPSTLTAIYKPLPIQLRIMIGFLTTCFVSSRSFLVKTMMEIVQTSSFLGFVGLPIRVLRWVIENYAWARKELLLELVKMLLQSFVAYTMVSAILQDLLPRYQPSRISSQDLISKFGTLPSPLSNYATVSPEAKYRVHYLKFKNIDGARASKVDLIHVNHGFGASSLSWLPAIPKLASTFNTSVVGHDAPGFGLTDRLKDDVSFYSIANSATIGSLLIQDHFICDANFSSETRNVLLMGHSLGSLTTLRMALLLTAMIPSIHLHLILVAPAVGFLKPPKTHAVSKTPRFGTIFRNVQRPFTRLLTGIGCYGLKRLVGRRLFWRNGLRTVWGDPDKLRESDVLRFQWHSIIKGWENGLFQFSRAQTQSFDIYASEHDLLNAVLNVPNVKSIHVIVGSKDSVVKPDRLYKFFQNFPGIPIHELDGLGHDPFEEDAELFVKTVQSMLPL